MLSRLRSQDLSSLALAPPEIVDWEQAAGFHFHFDRPQGQAHSAVTHSDLRLSDYLTGLSRVKGLNGLDTAFLRNRHIDVVDGSGVRLFRWPVWRCLVGEIQLDHVMYILDEGEFFEVRADYLQSLDAFIMDIPASGISLPNTTPTTSEGVYNIGAAATSVRRAILRIDFLAPGVLAMESKP